MAALNPSGLAYRLQRYVRQVGSRAYLVLAMVFTIAIVGDFGTLGLLKAAETRLFDTLVSHRLRVPAPDPDIVIIDIDEASLQAMAARHGRWPWPNAVLGELTRALEEQGVQALVFDILFSDRDTLRPESDAAFNAAIAESKTTFFPMLRLDPRNDALSKIPVGALPGARPIPRAVDAGSEGGANGAATIAMILPKVPAALDNGRLGTHQVEPDRDGVIRRYPAWTEYAGWRIPSLPQRIAEEFQFEGSAEREALLNWRGPPFTYQYISFVDAYRGLVTHDAPLKERFAGKIVVIGSTAPSLFDVKGSPMARIHPGVEILATAIDNFRHGDMLRERPRWLLMASALILIWSMALALTRQIPMDVFDTVFGVLQAGLLVLSYIVLNLSNWYIDTSAPLSLGLVYFAVARAYHGFAQKTLANGLLLRPPVAMRGDAYPADLPPAPHMAVLALRLPGCSAAERRRLQVQIDRLVAASSSGAGRTLRLAEDPGLVRLVLGECLLIYWLVEADDEAWAEDAQRMLATLSGWWRPDMGSRLQTGLASGALSQSDPRVGERWHDKAYGIILEAMHRCTQAEFQK